MKIFKSLTKRYLIFTPILLVIVVAQVETYSQLTTSGTFGAAVRLAIPILLAGLGGLYSEKTGVVNIGLEGMMIMGTWFGAWGGYTFGAWQGVFIGMLGGALLFAFLQRSAQILDLNDVPKEIEQMMQAFILLIVVVFYEVIRRFIVKQQIKDASKRTDE